MDSLFNANTHQEIKARIDKLTAETANTWGKMNPAQMFHHCQLPLKTALKTEPVKAKFNLMGMLFKKSMYNDKPWRKNMPTPKRFRIEDDHDFNAEKQTLVELIDTFYGRNEQQQWNPHPMFGKLTKEQWGKMQYKHLDHHLRSFGV